MNTNFVTKWDEYVRTENILGILLLVEALPEVNSLVDMTQLYTPLHLASRDGLITVVEVLLNKGANVHARTDYGQTPLHFVARYNRLECAEILLAKNPRIDCTDIYGQTPMYLADLLGHNECARLIESRGETK